MPFDLPHPTGVKRRPDPRETVALLAGLMALNAFAIDAMIPALPGDRRGAGRRRRESPPAGRGRLFPRLRRRRRSVWGPLADRFGRKPILAAGVALYAVFALLCGIAGSFELLIAGRVAMGASAAVTRVLVVAMVRDLFEGEAMARVMSLVFMVFMLVPVLAPNIGQAILLVAPWRAIFLRARRLWRARCGCGASCGCPRRFTPNIAARSMRARSAARCRRRRRDRLSLGYTLALTVDLRRADRLHRLDPADRLRRVRRAGS